MRRMALGFTLLIVGLAFAGKADAAPTGGTPWCQEDMRCWSWRTMGNEQRGIVTTNGRRLVVNAERFDRLNSLGRIDWCRSRRMRGDVG